MKRSISFLFVVLFVQSPIAQAGTVFSLLRELGNEKASDYSMSMSCYWARRVADGKQRLLGRSIQRRALIPRLPSIPEGSEIEEEPRNSIIAQSLKTSQEFTTASPKIFASEVDTKSEPAASLSAVLLAEEHFPTDCLFLTR